MAAWTLDGRTGLVTISDEMVTLLDLPNVTGIAFDDSVAFYPREHRDRIRELVDLCLAHGEPFDIEVPVRTPTTRTMWLRVMGEADVDEAGEVVGVHGAVADLTEARLSRLKLREQAGLLDNATDAILVLDLDGHVTSWNRAAEQLYGWTASEALGGHIADLVDGGDRAKHEAMVEILWTDGEWSGRLDNVNRDGNVVAIELHVNVIRDDLGAPVAVFSIASDVTERVRLEERLALSQKLESVGQLTGGLAHDFNNEQLVRRQTVAALRSLGYDVVEAEHAAAARLVLEAGSDSDSGRPPVDLVFSDIVMPGGTSGLELAVEVRRRFPELPILLTSGYTDDAERQGYEEFPLLQKPYRRSTLAHTVRRILDHTTSRHDARR